MLIVIVIVIVRQVVEVALRDGLKNGINLPSEPFDLDVGVAKFEGPIRRPGSARVILYMVELLKSFLLALDTP